MRPDKALCLITNKEIENLEFLSHKKKLGIKEYGIFWPTEYPLGYLLKTDWPEIPIIREEGLAKYLGVHSVFIRYEGKNITGSMKDYLITAAVEDNHLHENKKIYTVVSSGNHAVSLAHFAKEDNARAVIFVPASTSKIDTLRSFENAIVVCVNDAVFEDVYILANKIELPNTYNANVSNDFLFTGITPASKQILDYFEGENLTHVLSGVGNGSYIAGLSFGFDYFGNKSIKPVPVGMKGAFPTEKALRDGKSHVEYSDFLHPEHDIESAEGSIALASYSMPQLTHSVRKRGGLSLGSLTNLDIANAYSLLVERTNCFRLGFIPEPTGIMSLAAAIVHKDMFSTQDSLLLSFTGAGYKTIDDLDRFSGIHKQFIIEKVKKDPCFKEKKCNLNLNNVIYVDKTEDSIILSEKIAKMLNLSF